MRRGGFDAIVSNPPFIGGKKVSGALGTDYREYLKQRSRQRQARQRRPVLLLPASRHVGRAAAAGSASSPPIRSPRATLARSVWTRRSIWVGRSTGPRSHSPGRERHRWKSRSSGPGIRVGTKHVSSMAVEWQAITPSLDPQSRMHGNPFRLAANAGQSFQGSIVLGTGFILEPEEAQALIAKDPRNKAVLFPYLNGEDLNSRWDCSASRWVINFHDWPLERATAIFRRLRHSDERGRSHCRARTAIVRLYRERWWQYAEKQPALRRAIADLDHVLVFAQTTRTQMPVLVSANQVLSHMLVVFATNETSKLSLHSSRISILVDS